MFGVPELGDGMAVGCAEGVPARIRREKGEAVAVGAVRAIHGGAGVGLREVAVIGRGYGAAVVSLNVAAGEDPVLAEPREALLDVAMEGGVAPWAAGIVNADRVIRLEGTGEIFGGGKGDLAHGDAHLGVEGAGGVYAAAIGEGVGALGLDGVLGCDHMKIKKPRAVWLGVAGTLLPSAELPASGSRGPGSSDPVSAIRRPRVINLLRVKGNGGKSMMRGNYEL